MTWIKEIVEGLIEIYNTRDVYEILDCLDISLIKKSLPHGKKGNFLRDCLGNEIIFVSDNLSSIEEKNIIAHELGHLILHTDLRTRYYSESKLLNKNKIELQADKFAAELLIPDEISIEAGETIKCISCKLGVFEDLVRLKFKL